MPAWHAWHVSWKHLRLSQQAHMCIHFMAGDLASLALRCPALGPGQAAQTGTFCFTLGLGSGASSSLLLVLQ